MAAAWSTFWLEIAGKLKNKPIEDKELKNCVLFLDSPDVSSGRTQ